MLYHVVAVALNGVIGKDNKLPWHIPADLKHFKELTAGSTVIMGRKTFDSIGRALPGRENFVLSKFRSVPGDNLRFFKSFDEALENVTTPDAYIIGGASLYQQTLNQIDGIYMTKIFKEYEGDTYYPPIPETFKLKSSKPLMGDPRGPAMEVQYYENVKTADRRVSDRNISAEDEEELF